MKSRITFQKYNMTQILKIRKLSTAHYLPQIHKYSTPPHQHDAWELAFCFKGAVKIFSDSTPYTLHVNELLLHPPKTEHYLQVTSQKSSLFLISFICSSEVLRLLQNLPMSVDKNLRHHLLLIINELGNAFELQNGQLLLGEFHPSSHAPLGSEQMITCYMECFLINLLRSITCLENEPWSVTNLEKALENHLTSRVKEYVSAHLSERITLDDLAKSLHYSRSHLTAQFRSSTGMSIAQYISELRMEHAKQLILKGTMSLAQISSQLGFSSQQYFCKCFKDATGCSPSSYEDPATL